MGGKKGQEKRNRGPAALSLAQGPAGQMGQAITVAMLAAAQDGCECRACRALRAVNEQMMDEFAPEGE